MNSKSKYSTIDEYIEMFPANVQKLLKEMRETISSTAPEAAEAISYGIPTFKLKGKNLVHFGGFKDHVSFFPTSSGTSEFKKELCKYLVTKGTIRFPLDEPIPFDLIKRITLYRVKQIQEK